MQIFFVCQVWFVQFFEFCGSDIARQNVYFDKVCANEAVRCGKNLKTLWVPVFYLGGFLNSTCSGNLTFSKNTGIVQMQVGVSTRAIRETRHGSVF